MTTRTLAVLPFCVKVLACVKFLAPQTPTSKPIVGCPAIQILPDSQPTSTPCLVKMDQLAAIVGKHIPTNTAADVQARKQMKKTAPHSESRHPTKLSCLSMS